MNHPAQRYNNSPEQFPWFGGLLLLCLLLARPALATDALWPPADQIGQVFNYSVPGNPPPTIDATAFDNENQFTINFSALTANPEIFETWNTVNYTNNGLMVANSPVATNGIFLAQSPGCGFLFDTQTTNVIPHQMAGTFYNAGAIRANSVFDTGPNFFALFTVGKITVLATNILNPGMVSVGQNGLLQLTGQNVDLTRSLLAVEDLNTELNVLTNLFVGLNFFVPLNLSVLAASVGHETNFINPAAQFSLPNPSSDNFLPPLFLGLKNATAYVDDTLVGPSNRVVRAVFISNPVPGVTNNVYFHTAFPSQFGPIFFNDILVEWAGTYLNPATGQVNTNYMYLEDDFGETTNLQVNFNGGPVNYSWLAQWPYIFGPTSPSGLPPGTFKNGFITNDYSYESIQLIATTVATNASGINPSGALTNLPGRLQINASRVLDLTLAQMSGPNYMSLTATNHFEGSVGASIFSPFSDISLGVTNGLLSVSNLLAPSIPNWNGPVQVFSARWGEVDALGVTNSYHVLLVNTRAVPTTPPFVQDLILHSTNLFVSDTFNVYRKLSIDATSLTVTTNLNTGGFGSPDGELNWYGPTALNTTQLPNLRWLTNNGAIRAANLAVFGSATVPYGAVFNTGLIADQGTTVYVSNFVSSGMITNGPGSFALQSLTTTLTNGSIFAGGNISFATLSLLTSNLMLSAGKALNLTVTNQLTDSDSTNGSFWSVGAQALSGSAGVYLNNGFNLPRLPTNPPTGDLRATSVTNIAPSGRLINNLWAGVDRGAVPAGYTNNVAVGQLVLDSLGIPPLTLFYFSGTGVSNAIYVDNLELRDNCTNTDGSGNVPALSFNTNLVIYYAQATIGGVSVAEKLNHRNGDHLRWVPTYAGRFSSTAIITPDGTTNIVNAALATSPIIDSDGDGIPNGADPTPFFQASDIHPTSVVTNLPPKSVRVQWMTVPNATNYIYYSTNLISTNWLPFTNFSRFYWGANMAVSNYAHSNFFPSPQPYPSPATNVWIYDAITNTPHFYRIAVQPWLTYPF